MVGTIADARARVLQCHIQELLRRRVIGLKLAEGKTMAHLTLGGLQELSEAGCERIIERLAFGVRVMPFEPPGLPHRCINSPLNVKTR